MPFIKVPLSDAKEQEPVPEGTYPVRIVKAEDGTSKKGNMMTTVTLRIEDPDFPNASLFSHWITYPGPNTPADQRAMRLRDIGRFLELFEIPGEPDGFNTDDLMGATATADIKQEPSDDDPNVIYNRLVLPRMKGEAAKVGGRKRRSAA